MLLSLFLAFASVGLSSYALPPAPTVNLGDAQFTGVYRGEDNQLSWFRGIKYAEAPRFDLPIPITSYPKGKHDATHFGASCLSQGPKVPKYWLDTTLQSIKSEFWNLILPESEDCLHINVMKPTNVKKTDKVPVVVYIYGGGFTGGNSALPIYYGQHVVDHSVEVGKPVIFVSFNYRVSAWGFLASKEILEDDAANAGIHDQREALYWVQRNIAAFGGDPGKVTLWGQSAGAMSAALHMVLEGGNHKNLFRGVIMQSGSILPITHVTDGQGEYDDIVKKVGCSQQLDTLACLRGLPVSKLQAVIRETRDPFDYTGMADPAWAPRIDAYFLSELPSKSISEGRYARVPFISGNVQDEGTWFAKASLNVTTAEKTKKYLASDFLQPVTPEELEMVLDYYPEDPAKGSPYNTGSENAITPQYKRIASFVGDLGFIAPKRLLNDLTEKCDKWTYTYRRKMYNHRGGWLMGDSTMGSFHGIDLFNSFAWGFPGSAELHWYFLNFVWDLTPNGRFSRHLPQWPQYDPSERKMLDFVDNEDADIVQVARDTDREGAIAFLNHLMIKYGDHRLDNKESNVNDVD